MIFARKIDKPHILAECEDKWVNGDFPFETLAELADGRGDKGLSVYAVSSRRDERLRRLAVAMHMGLGSPGTPQNTQFRFVTEKDLAAIGLLVRQSKGTLKYHSDLNEVHYDITGVDGPKSIALMKSLMKSEPLVVPSVKIIDEIARNVRLSEIKLEQLAKGFLPEMRPVMRLSERFRVAPSK